MRTAHAIQQHNTMGKKRRPRKTEAAMPAALKARANGAAAPYTADQLLDRVDEYMAALEHEPALQFCARALEMEPDNTRALESMAMLLLEAGDLDQAYQVR